jgi:peptidoglycan hydrolase CwlO-like protein
MTERFTLLERTLIEMQGEIERLQKRVSDADECIEEQEEMLEELQAEIEHLRAVIRLRKLQDAEIKRLQTIISEGLPC